ncbi:RNA polymerase sigma factor (sigma-70 family) [Parabacteroides sp. PF5-5]|uniref:RNA polymerase sigma factor n=1 Tax=unclassified Parabacteroides TaxID=2649774 RepID=UPI002475D582|nr:MULTISPECIES: RNA polymerase sigma factor [unclassified Parabacteroides]MDH6306538.1 RNA polymerase sigma factor (sigma-70 family) [Parabacteroides sp. PH5-39]MDH6317505.1 RNA polymerase sigma factor (sigma-70 family) [Parabacteroides sp. PF5-13]MDH6321192.1 RNA polymerase sigma factor (sigma-70 family) [Parabacteroides sp. PH5-13]MDH6324924.1 RNA polymerase sigma factor (sigma-70 family) [Parabacteroides sp. PH5-8]MDH6328633.1 RNA polymerase sigma factor (sigma-70 family) [Parabacteroides 
MNALQFQKQLLSLQDNMMNFALMLTANREDAQDLLQDTTLKVLGNQDKFVDNVNFKGWVLTVMRNIFINDYHKAVRAQTVIDQNTDVYNVDVYNESGFSNPEGSYEIQEITNAIGHLNEDLKVPFSMYLSGYKYNEIADKLNIPLGTVKSRIFFARQELQKELKDFYQN